MEGLELIEELRCDARDLVVVGLVDDDAAQGPEEVLDAEIEDVVEARRGQMAVGGIIFIEQAFAETAAADDHFRTARHVEDGLDDGSTSDDEV